MAAKLVGAHGFASVEVSDPQVCPLPQLPIEDLEAPTVEDPEPPPPPLLSVVRPESTMARPPPGIPSAAQVMGRVGGENFPVALRLLPSAIRSQLLAVYGFARLVDQLGDEAPGDRLSQLAWLEAELDRAYQGRAVHPVMVSLGRTLDEVDLPREAFCDLIEANRRDQRVSRYATWEDLLEYCRYSANPVGRLVLTILGASTPERQLLSDQVCTGLQVLEHTQDIGEDAGRGRIYLPAQDMVRFGCTTQDLGGSWAGPGLRAAVALQCARARALLGAGEALVASLPGMARVAVAGFTAGGLAALDSVERADFDVLAVRCRPTHLGMCRHAAFLLSKGLGSWQ